MSAMLIPKMLRICGHDINIVRRSLDGDFGHWDFEKNEIVIHDNLPQSQVEATLFHEMLHVMNAPMGDSDYGHAFLESLSLQIYQTLKDNHLLNMAKNSTGLSKKYPKALKTKAAKTVKKVAKTTKKAVKKVAKKTK